MFRTPGSRYALRAIVAAALAGLAVAGTVWIDNPYVKVASAAVGALAAYLGIGAASGSVEPFVGNKLANAEVPVPPADPVPPNK